MNRKFYIRTFGCQMNAADSSVMRGILENRSFEFTEKPEEADLIIFNSCSIREHAEDRMFSNLGLAMKKNPKAAFILAGCTAKRHGAKLFKRFPHLGAVVAPSELFSIGETAEKVLSGAAGIEALEGGGYGFVPRHGGVSEFVVIQTGCDNYCSYCVVPFLRAAERYRPAEDILREVRCLAASGTKEIVFLGQNVNSYRDEKTGGDFTDLLARAAEIDGILRIRFLTSHPKDISAKLIDEFARNPRLARHLHLPVQSGSDSVLLAMNRKYTSADYLGIVEKLRESAKDVALTTDVIVGFPGETDSDFADTLALIRKADFDGVYAFKYSPREGTASFKMEDDVPEEVKKERLSAGLALAKELALKKREAYIGQKAETLFENNDVGHSSQNYLVFKKGAKAGDFGQVPVKAVSGFRLMAE
ncbi:MAG: tRNA (N6-isopentenyl adenosine(37)-C2)-methylthiotransferase MiaB [Candidatus Omnitrophota bacterium]|nr:tRNA (N6-isopentenyl adenosine(37)-C2)-methylthiotransferase MiaB [Candidatus Omnitrophota bacterium]MBU3929202.1 tRNA (N6-isopentenyl adenosine(37)-C2)-methylthiotransferase MiaB [bacterium]MBU4123746.1 tRNA (N6-isopentenyl adenosine(37)-C2)-methylthiotransferase MiaB [bacterium]